MRLLKEKYGMEKGGFFPKLKNGPIGYSYWKGFTKVSVFFKWLTKFKVGSGEIVRFWHDAWVSDFPLVSLFPKFF